MTTVARLVAVLEGDNSHLARTFRESESLADKLGASIRRVGENALSFGAGMAGLQGLERGFGAVKDAVFGMNASLETSTLQFTTLMGDADRSHQHVADLFEFAKKTPFETGPVIEASRRLETFGGAALNTMANIQLIGDAAAATSAPIQELGFWVGRAYSMIQGGQPFGEAAMRLQELAVLSAPARQQMENLQKSGAATSEVWKVLQTDLARFNGAMIAQANTWEGLVSTFVDGAKMTIAQGFQPMFELAKRALMGINAAMGSPDFEAAVKRMTDWLGKAIPEAAVRTVEVAAALGGAFSNAAGMIAQVVGKVAEGFTGLAGIAQTAMTGLATFIANIAGVIAHSMLLISPFTRHSPSLVDQVLDGLRIIEDAWDRLADRLGQSTADAAKSGIEAIVRLKGALMSLAEATTGRELGAQVFALNRFGGADAVSAFTDANAALADMRTEYARLTIELEDANDAIKIERDELDLVKQDHQDLQQILSVETKQLSDWKAELQEIGRTPILEAQPLADSVKLASDRLGEATLQLLNMKVAAADTIESFRSRTEVLNDTIKDTRDRLSGLTTKLGDLKERMSDLLTGPLTEELPFKQQLQSLGDQILSTELDIARARARGADPKSYQTLTAQLDKLRSRQEAVRLEMEKAVGPLKRQIEAQKDLAAGVAPISFTDRMAGLQNLVPQITSLNEQIAAEKSTMKTAEDALSALTAEQKAALAPIEAQERVVSHLKDTQQLLKEQYEQTIAPLNAMLDALVNKKPDPTPYAELAARAGDLRAAIDEAEPRVADLKLQEADLASQVAVNERVYRDHQKALEPLTEAHRMLGDEIQAVERHLKDMVDLATSEQDRLAQLAKGTALTIPQAPGTVGAPAVGNLPDFFDPEQQKRLDEATAKMQDDMGKIKLAFDDVGTTLAPLASNFNGLNTNLASMTSVATGVLGAFVAFQAITFVGPLIGSIAAAIGGSGGLSAVLLALGGPITIIAAAVAALVLAWVTDFGGIQEKTQAFVAALTDWVDKEIVPRLQAVATFLDQTVKPAFDRFGAFVQDQVIPRVNNLISMMGEFRAFLDTYIVPLIVKLYEVEFAALARIVFEVTSRFQGASDALNGNAGMKMALDSVSGGVNGLITLLGQLGDVAHTIFENIRKWANDNLLPWLNSLAGTLDAVKTFLNTRPPAPEGGAVAGGGFASGTPYFGGGYALVGEQGPEVVRLPQGAAIYPNGEWPARQQGDTYNITTQVTAGLIFDQARQIADVLAHETAQGVIDAARMGG